MSLLHRPFIPRVNFETRDEFGVPFIAPGNRIHLGFQIVVKGSSAPTPAKTETAETETEYVVTAVFLSDRLREKDITENALYYHVEFHHTLGNQKHRLFLGFDKNARVNEKRLVLSAVHFDTSPNWVVKGMVENVAGFVALGSTSLFFAADTMEPRDDLSLAHLTVTYEEEVGKPGWKRLVNYPWTIGEDVLDSPKCPPFIEIGDERTRRRYLGWFDAMREARVNKARAEAAMKLEQIRAHNREHKRRRRAEVKRLVREQREAAARAYREARMKSQPQHAPPQYAPQFAPPQYAPPQYTQPQYVPPSAPAFTRTFSPTSISSQESKSSNGSQESKSSKRSNGSAASTTSTTSTYTRQMKEAEMNQTFLSLIVQHVQKFSQMAHTFPHSGVSLPGGISMDPALLGDDDDFTWDEEPEMEVLVNRLVEEN